MGRKLIRRMPTDEDRSNKVSKGHAGIVVAQHVLLFSSGYVIASTAYLIHTGSITNDLLPTAVILVFAVCIHGISGYFI
jgi:ABC-type transport system involved in cytochrome bd biosynthesis fused ATPase/permease subunit